MLFKFVVFDWFGLCVHCAGAFVVVVVTGAGVGFSADGCV